MLWYSINYKNLSSDPTDGHIHYSIIPPTKRPGDQVGPSVDKLDSFPDGAGRSGKITGDWRWDETHNVLTDELVDSLFDGELYFNISTENHATGEIRGQIVDPNAATPIPLPPAAWTGIMGLGRAAAHRDALRGGRGERCNHAAERTRGKPIADRGHPDRGPLALRHDFPSGTPVRRVPLTNCPRPPLGGTRHGRRHRQQALPVLRCSRCCCVSASRSG